MGEGLSSAPMMGVLQAGGQAQGGRPNPADSPLLSQCRPEADTHFPHPLGPAQGRTGQRLVNTPADHTQAG